MAKTMRDVLVEQNVKPITNVSGTPVVTFKEQMEAAEQGIKDKVDFGVRKLNPDGTIAKSFYSSAAISMDTFFMNRFRVVDNELQLVTAQTPEGYRAIKEQKTGHIFAKQILAHTLKRENGKLVFDKNIMVSDTDFVSFFTKSLDEEAMREVLPLLQNGESSTPNEKLPI